MAFERFPYSNFHDLNLDWIIEQVKTWAAEWEQAKALIEEIDYEFEEFNRRLNDVEVDTLRLDTLTSKLELNYNTLASTVSGLSNNLAQLQRTVADNYEELDERVTVLENSSIIYMFSPFTGQYEPITQVITELSQFHLEDALTAAEYDALDMTASYYDAKVLTAYQYDSSGKILLP